LGSSSNAPKGERFDCTGQVLTQRENDGDSEEFDSPEAKRIQGLLQVAWTEEFGAEITPSRKF